MLLKNLPKLLSVPGQAWKIQIVLSSFIFLGQTGVGHGSGKAVILGLAGYDPETIDADLVPSILDKISQEEVIYLDQQQCVTFPRKNAIEFHRRNTTINIKYATIKIKFEAEILCT